MSGIWLVEIDEEAATVHVDLVIGQRAEVDGEDLDAWLPDTRPFSLEGPTGTVHAFVHPRDIRVWRHPRRNARPTSCWCTAGRPATKAASPTRRRCSSRVAASGCWR
jgi:hypothetical protein